MDIVFGVIVGLIILIFLVVVHELGHAIAAVRSGVVVEEFGIGFPPRAWGVKLKNGVLFSLNWLPLGGFVKMKGEYDASDEPGDYGAASFWQKSKILLAGVAVNWVVAAILLTILAWTGLPKVLPNQFFVQSDTRVVISPVEAAVVTDGSPAQKAGIKTGDKIVNINGETVATPDTLLILTKRYHGKEVPIKVIQDVAGEKQANTLTVKLNSESAPGKGYLGVVPAQQETIKAGWSAPVTGVVTTAQFSWLTLTGVKDLAVKTVEGVALKFSPNAAQREAAGKNLSEASQSVAGPIGILGVIFPAAAKAGFTQLVFLTAIISLTLAVMNILPIPALDGGRWFTMAVFRALRKPLTKEREEKIQATGFIALMTLIVVVTFADVGKLF